MFKSFPLRAFPSAVLEKPGEKTELVKLEKSYITALVRTFQSELESPGVGVSRTGEELPKISEDESSS